MGTVYQFGAFRVDPVRRVLLREGELVPVTPKAFSILLLLIESHGRIVTKEELIQGAWSGAQVSDANLMQNISSLRKALGERAGDSRFIVTIPGQGYGFAGELIEGTDEEPAVPSPSVPPSPPLPAPEAALVSPALPSLQAPPRTLLLPNITGRQRRVLFLIVLGAVLFLLSTSALVVWRRGAQARLARGETGSVSAGAGAVASRPGIAVLGLWNLSGDLQADWLGPAFAEMLATELSAGGRVRVISGENVARVRRSLGNPPLRNLDSATLQKLHGLLGADLIIEGAYLVLPGKKAQVRLDLRVLSVPAGDVVTSVAEVGEERDLFGLVARTGTHLRRSLGLADLTPTQARAAQALIPATPEAARLYIQGLERLRAFDHPGALGLLREAAQLDPSSAMIRSALAQAWIDLGEDARAVAEAREALRLAVSMPREDRLAAEARLRAASREWIRAAELYRSLWTFYPDNLEYGLQLAACLTAAGNGEDASEVFAALRRLPQPVSDDPRIDLAEARLAKRIAEPLREKRLAELAIAKGKKSGESLIVAQGLLLQGDALLLQARPAEALVVVDQARELFAAAGHHLAVAMALAHRGVALHELSDLDGAERAYSEALAIAQRLGSSQWTAGQKANLGLLWQSRGDLPRARALLEEAHALYIRMGDRVLQARADLSIGEVLHVQGDLAAAQTRFEQALDLARQTGNRTDEGRAASRLGMVLAERGRLREARQLHEGAFARLRQMGDENRAASALAESARVLGSLGDLPLARRRVERALAAKRQSGDRIGTAEVLDTLAELADLQGDLETLRRAADQQLQIARETGTPIATARALRRLGRATLASGDPEAARRALVSALETAEKAREELEVLEIRLDLAHLELDEKHPAEAVRLARAAAAWIGERDLPAAEARVFALLAGALAAQGDAQGAEEAARRSRDALARTEDAGLPVALAPHLARADVARGDARTAVRDLRRAIQQAQALGFTAAALEARLALGEMLAQRGDPAARPALQQLRRDAEARGFGRVARRAGA